jgi:hypothetical protein
MLSHDRATLQLVAHELKLKLLTILNFGNGYQSAAVNRSGENGVRENANGGDGGSVSQQVSAPSCAIPGGFQRLNQVWRLFVAWKMAEGENLRTNILRIGFPVIPKFKRENPSGVIETLQSPMSVSPGHTAVLAAVGSGAWMMRSKVSGHELVSSSVLSQFLNR